MITTKSVEASTVTETTTQATVDTVESIALDEVNGGWMYSPYAAAYANPYVAAARYEAHVERRAEWMASRAGWWGY